jgi:hypothetical protein
MSTELSTENRKQNIKESLTSLERDREMGKKVSMI